MTRELELLNVERSAANSFIYESIRRFNDFSEAIEKETGSPQPPFYYLQLHPRFDECMEFVKKSNAIGNRLNILTSVGYGELLGYCISIIDGRESEFIQKNKGGFINGRGAE